MKKFTCILILILFSSCNNENANDCWQTAGKIIQQEVEVPSFEKILVQKKIELILTQGATQKVIIETGKNLLSDITVEVIDNEIILTNNNECNFFREYGITKIYITSPNITSIRNASELNISSNGTLAYPSLYLRSSGEKQKFLAVGDWHLSIATENLNIWSNGIANFYLDGTTDNLNINFSDGDTRFEGKNLIAKNIILKQVSSNDMVLFPTESLTGSIHSVGDVISYNKPPVVSVDQQSVGKLIFK
jgi:hypothetical protein